MKTTGLYPCVGVDAAGSGMVSQAGGLLLTETVRVSGLGAELSRVLAPWRKPLARHDPAKVVTDLAITLGLGGDCLADIAVLRGEPGLFGPVASASTVSRTVDALADDVEAVLKAINVARGAARARVWTLAGQHAPDTGRAVDDPLIIDLDATLVGAHSDKQGAAPTFKRGYGFHPLCAFVDHGPDGSGEPLAVMLRPGNAGSNTAADHIALVRDALKQLPSHRAGTRPGHKVLIRTDAAGCTHDFLDWIVTQRLSYSVGFTLPDDLTQMLPRIPKQAWTPAIDSDGRVRDGAWVADVTALLKLSRWPRGMRVIVRKERPPPRRPTAPDRRRRAPHHRVRHQHHPRTARRPRTTPPAPGPRRRPDPLRQGHRTQEPPLARLRPEPDLVRDRRPGLRTHHLDATTRLHQPRRHHPRRAPLGTQTPTPTTVLDRREARPDRPPHHRAPRPQQLLDHPAAHRPHPAPRSHRTRLTTTHPSLRPAPDPARGTGVHPRRHSGPRPTHLQQPTSNASCRAAPNGQQRSHERSGLVCVQVEETRDLPCGLNQSCGVEPAIGSECLA